MSSPLLPESLESALKLHPLPEALAAVLTHFGCQAGTYHAVRGDLLHLKASHNIPAPVVQIVQWVPVGKGIAGLAAQRGEPVSLCNLQTDASGQARPGAKATGMEGSLAVPAFDSQGQLKGVLGIAKAAAYDWSETEKKAVSAAAHLLAERSVVE
jgi:L-methionine (R)-S-oxide reductase